MNKKAEFQIPTIPFSLGLHPWWVDKLDRDLFFSWLETASESPLFLALGEIGLDRVCHVPWEAQLEVLRAQLEWHREKSPRLPIVLHCVCAHSDLMRELKALRDGPPLILHGYNGNEEITRQWLRWENVYFSVGEHLFRERAAVLKSLPLVPLDRLFFETDEGGVIEDVYARGSEVLGVELGDLVKGVFGSWVRVFNPVR